MAYNVNKMKYHKVFVTVTLILLVIVILLGIYLIWNSTYIYAVKNKKALLSIACDGSDECVELSFTLKTTINTKTGTLLKVLPSQKNNVIYLEKISDDSLSDYGFILCVKNNNIVLSANTKQGLSLGIKYLTEKYCDKTTMKLKRSTKYISDGLDVLVAPKIIEIAIPGLKRDYTFMQISDTHITLADTTEPNNIRQAASDRSAAFPGSDGITPAERFKYYFQYADKIGCDAALLTGDIIDFPSEANIRILTETLKSSPVKTLYTLGNHDWSFSWDYHTQITKDTYLPRFNDITNRNIAFQKLEFDDLLVLAIDNSTDQVNPDALDLTKQALKTDKPVIIIMHVPLYADTLYQPTVDTWSSPIILGSGGISPSQCSQEFISAITAEDSPVKAVFAGHLHFAHVDKINDNITQYVSESNSNGTCTIYKIKGSN